MIDDISARLLHDKATHGGTLMETEQAALEAWYACADKEEATQLAALSPGLPTLEELRFEVSAAAKQLNQVTLRIQA